MNRTVTVAALAALVAGGVLAEETQGYVPTQENLDARKAFAEKRFGIFIHWGIYSLFGQGEWYLNSKALDKNEYAKAANAFYPHAFDGNAWAAAIADSGAKYVCFTSRHHDGFSMWDTKASDYDIEHTPYAKDIVAQLAKGCEANGLTLNLYYSLMDWTRDDYPVGRERWVKGRDPKKANYASYLAFMKAQLTELLTGYGKIGAIWFDGYWDHDPRWVKPESFVVPPLDWKMDELYALIHGLQPACLCANNAHIEMLPGEDIQLYERDLPGENKAGFSKGQVEDVRYPREMCETMNGHWGYKADDLNWKSSGDLIRLLAKAAAKGSNLLLNIGPQPDGNLPAESLRILKEMGVWMKANGESIYGTEAGPARIGDQVVTTAKKGVVYVHVLDPKMKEFSLKIPGRIVEARYLENDGKFRFEQRDGYTFFSIRTSEKSADTVLKLTLGGISAKLEPSQLIVQDEFKGFPRTIFWFEGRKAWVVEPKDPREDGAWVWCMEWPFAFVTTAGQVNALERGYRYVTYECGKGMQDEEIEGCKHLQAFLVKELGLQPKVNLIGMSWGGFYSIRYASTVPENIRKIYIDNPLLNFDGFHSGPRGWKKGDCAWSDDPRLSVNRAEPIAKAGIPILLMYGDADDVCPPHLNCLPFAERFVKAGGDIKILKRPGAKHHPHGVTGENKNLVVDFFEGRGKIGAFAHYLLKKEQFDRIGEYDVDGVVADLKQMGADYFFLTLGQNTGFFCSPNATYEKTLGVASNACCSARDIPAELYAKMGELSLGLYLPCQPPFKDERTVEAFAMGEKVDKWGNRAITLESARRWAKVIEEWSVRYGDKVKAWWFDGAYEKCKFSKEIAELYTAAVKKGNPKALVAFNFDVGIRAYMPMEDYTAGELNELAEVVCEGPTFEGRRWHALTFMGNSWGDKGIRVSPEAWAKTVNAAAAKGGSVSVDMNVDKPSGRFDPAQLEVFSRIQQSASRR